ncbi:MAG TPA: DUF3943 domain-containing protein [Planctomycetota bacterium]|nr:DUF3943 domain-containing protein [Planctomycetota bacterium]
MAPTEAPPGRPQQGPAWGDEASKSYVIPAVEIVGFEFLLNAYDRRYDVEDVYRTDWSSIRRNLHRGWIIDDDPFATNQIMHPYQGSLVHGFARSAGLTYWESLGYDAAGSALWEVAGETGPPSANDLITTTFGGSFLGEALFRMAGFLLEGGGRSPGLFRELGAAIISPPTGINRVAFGDRFDGAYPSHEASTFMRFGVGARRNARLADLGALSDAPREEAVADFSFEYGLPGKPGYTYTRPFDYFQFEAAATSSSRALPESIMTRGLLYGAPYAVGDSYRGIWGLYGSYDYMSPEVFSVSSTALSLGTTGQIRVSDVVTLQGTLLAGVGWTAVGTIADARTDRDFHYGYSPQGLAAFRFIFGDVAMLDMTGREYYVGGYFSHDETVRENILRGQVSLTVRVYGHHALGIQFVSSVRNSSLFDVVGGFEEVGALSIFYTYISEPDFGAVDWRDIGHP